MKLGSFQSIKNCVFNGMQVNVSSQSKNCDFTLSPVGNKIEVTKHHQNDEVEVFFTFRNGDKFRPDLENFLEGWVDTVNAEDCVVHIY